MINDLEKSEIKTTLRKHYSAKIREHLQTVGVVPKKASESSKSYIQLVVNGREECLAVEFEILRLVQQTKRHNKELAKQRKLLLKK